MSEHDWTKIPTLEEFEDGEIIQAEQFNYLHDDIHDNVNQFVDEVADAVDDIESDISTLQSRATSSESDISALETLTDSHTSTLATHTSTLSSHGTRLTDAESAITTAEGNIESLGVRMTDAESDIDTAQNDINTIEIKLGNDEADISEMKGDIHDNKSTLNYHDGLLLEHGSSLLLLSTDLANTKGRVTTLEEDIVDIKESAIVVTLEGNEPPFTASHTFEEIVTAIMDEKTVSLLHKPEVGVFVPLQLAGIDPEYEIQFYSALLYITVTVNIDDEWRVDG